MVKVIFFDFWGTLVESGVLPSPVKQVKRILFIKEDFQSFIVKFEQTFMTKTFKNLSEGFEEVAKAFNIKPTKDMIERLVGLWNKKNLMATPYPEAIDVLKELKKSCKLVLIANTDCFGMEQLLERFGMEKYFDLVVLSYKEGYLKTDKELFLKALKKLKAKPDDAVMVGDSLESDMKAAQNAGIKSILSDRRNLRDYKPKITNLKDLPALLKNEK